MNKLATSTYSIRKSFLDYFKNHGHPVVASSSLVPEGDHSLLFTVAGMCQFKDFFINPKLTPYPRAASSQKCLRVGGKHNDLDNIGRTARHQTFFEMLGNFSFGDYSRRDAINFAWNFLTKEINLPSDRLVVTVLYDDEESVDIWHKDILLPKDRIIRKSSDDNFWSMSANSGPCGPCTEIFWDQLHKVDGDRYLEIWNLVFMNYEQSLTPDNKIVYNPLAQPCIDTGMGLERLASVVQDSGVPTNFDIDVMMPLRGALYKILDETDPQLRSSDEVEIEIFVRIIIDHLRSVTLLLAEGLFPDGKKRGAVLRRLIRRSVLFGYKLGIRQPFLSALVPVFAQITAEPDWFPEIVDKLQAITYLLNVEEVSAFENIEKLNSILERKNKHNARDKWVITAELAFEMWNSLGIPIELIEEVGPQVCSFVDMEGFNKLKEEKAALAKPSWVGSGAEKKASAFLNWQFDIFPRFVGYNELDCLTTILAGTVLDAMHHPVGSKPDMHYAWICLKDCPFYPESGGQVGDIGFLAMRIPETGVVLSFTVIDTIRPYKDGIAVMLEHASLDDLHLVVQPGALVECHVDREFRKCVMQSHSACHLLHSVLRTTLGEHVQQAGSKVGRGWFRLDFLHHNAVGPELLSSIEDRINEAIYSNIPVRTTEERYLEAKNQAVGLFSEKYGETVRVVEIEGWSKEICCGTHVNSSGDILAVKILSESTVGKGKRRIECYVGKMALKELTKKARTCDDIGVKVIPGAKFPEIHEIDSKISFIVKENQKLKQQLKLEQKEKGELYMRIESLEKRLSAQEGVTSEALN